MGILGCSSIAAKDTVFTFSVLAAHVCQSFLTELIRPLFEQLCGCLRIGRRCRIYEAFESQEKDG